MVICHGCVKLPEGNDIGHRWPQSLLMFPARQAKDTAVWTNPVLWSLDMDSTSWVAEDGEKPQESKLHIIVDLGTEKNPN